MAWNDLFNAQVQTDPSSFNYVAEQDKVKRRRALAELLQQQSFQQERGQFVPGGPAGFYVAPNRFTPLAKMLTAGLSAKVGRDADSMQSDVDKASQAALAHQLQHLNDGTVDPYSPARDSEAANIIGGGSEVAGTARPPEDEQAQSMAVRDAMASVIPTDLPPLPKPVAAIGGGAPTGPSTPVDPANAAAAASNRSVLTNIRGNVAERNKRLGLALQGKPASTGGATGSWGDPVAPAAPTVPPQLPQAQPAQAPPLAPPTPVAPELSLATSAPTNPIVAANAGGSTPPSVEQTVARLAALANTGPMGAQVADAQLQSLFGGKNGAYKVELSRDPISGALAVVRVNTKTGQTDVQQAGAGSTGVLKPGDHLPAIKQQYSGVTTAEQLQEANAGLIRAGVSPALLTIDVSAARRMGGQAEAIKGENESESTYQSSKARMTRANDQLTAILNPQSGAPSINDGTGLSGSIAASMPWATNSAEIRGRVKDAVSNMVMSTIQAMKAGGVGTSAFNSDAESARLEASLGSIDWTRMSATEITSKLSQLQLDAQDAMDRLDAARSKSVSGTQRTQPSTPPASLPAPARGQTVSASQYGF